jgi:hypothetical protein
MWLTAARMEAAEAAIRFPTCGRATTLPLAFSQALSLLWTEDEAEPN